MPENETKDDQDGRQLSAKEKLSREIQTRLDEAKEIQEQSIELHNKAKEEEDPEVAQELEFEARGLDKKAAKLMKTAERLQSGWLQGGATGAGVGAGIASGIGVTVGSLVTGVVAVPTAGLGMLLGAGTGLIHGPWVKYIDTLSEEEKDSITKEAEQEADKIAKS